MVDNECCFVGQNHAWILRVLCRTWHGTDGRRVYVRKSRRTLFKQVFIFVAEL